MFGVGWNYISILLSSAGIVGNARTTKCHAYEALQPLSLPPFVEISFELVDNHVVY